MEKKKKFSLLKKILLIIIIAGISLIPNIMHKNAVFADSGFGTSYHSSGSSSSSGSSHSSGSSSYSGGSSYSSGSDSDGSGGSWVNMVIFFIIIIAIIIYANKNKSNNNTANVTNINDSDIENKIKEIIPEFNKKEFLQDGYKIYCDVQNAWMNFKLDDVKDEITDELYNMYDSQLSTLDIKGEQNIMKDFKLVNSYLKNFANQNGNMTIVTGYVIEMYDYIIEKDTGKVLRGTSNNKIRVTYEMKFRKTLNKTTELKNCPNCGAEININSSGVCPYCSSKIVVDNTKWVLTEKKTINQDNI